MFRIVLLALYSFDCWTSAVGGFDSSGRHSCLNQVQVSAVATTETRQSKMHLGIVFKSWEYVFQRKITMRQSLAYNRALKALLSDSLHPSPK